MRQNRLRTVWSQGGRVINFWMESPSPDAVQAISRSGYDSVLFDMQHSPVDFKDLYLAQLALGDSEIASIVRVPGIEPGLIMKLLDNGFEAVMCPVVDTREQAEAFVGACRYPPAGYRSNGATVRAMRGASALEYFAGADESIVTIAQIESLTALRNVDAICTTPGLDAVFVGPTDLAISAGGPPVTDYADPSVIEHHKAIITAAHNAGIKVGVLAAGAQEVKTVLNWGVDLVSCASDLELIVSGAAQVLADTRIAIAAVESGR
jgi:4-hydroxy-2-oxoheptanedioate aldolase